LKLLPSEPIQKVCKEINVPKEKLPNTNRLAKKYKINNHKNKNNKHSRKSVNICKAWLKINLEKEGMKLINESARGEFCLDHLNKRINKPRVWWPLGRNAI